MSLPFSEEEQLTSLPAESRKDTDPDTRPLEVALMLTQWRGTFSSRVSVTTVSSSTS